MQVYLVGGAVRDRLLGRPIKERDYVVVGANPEMMLAKGFQQVGSAFPIFLHPQTREEYALARIRRSGGQDEGSAGPVTLEQDLARRDLTINAIAEDEHGELIDPFGGREDLQKRQLRHVSDAFGEDPIRILRVARFMARYADLGFKVAPETRSLMKELIADGCLEGLVPERVWQELTGALGEAQPRSFFETLRAVGALQQVFPEIDALWGVPQPVQWHPEVDCGEHTMLALQAVVELSDDRAIRFATLTHDLGKATTPQRILPSHYGHEERGVKLIQRMCGRLKAPARFRELACRCATYHGYLHRLYELRPKTVLKLLTGLDAFRQPERLQQFILVCQADYLGRKGLQHRPYPQADDLKRIYRAAAEVTSATQDATLMGRLLGEAIDKERIQRIKEVMNSLQVGVD
ncbi:MAG: multifunctional CCA tRNA nucleotidyl transferase/2'3'-cyclic phosphodiesterase/2'nucleotidase/phosphatase [gamma proteobacterium symbiont of Ctena orbiculata]|nr:MAG: multifunctional CCA tRNA nucleotidyl transferase/2'3'-cyclic phosphodiesterase/2'nucleotidase/phosphatase [gamma proteobacterium symbiont of Ctena orbiculata]